MGLRHLEPRQPQPCAAKRTDICAASDFEPGKPCCIFGIDRAKVEPRASLIREVISGLHQDCMMGVAGPPLIAGPSQMIGGDGPMPQKQHRRDHIVFPFGPEDDHILWFDHGVGLHDTVRQGPEPFAALLCLVGLQEPSMQRIIKGRVLQV